MARVHVTHVNLARGFRGGERQTELLVRGLAEVGVPQRLVTRSGKLLERLDGCAGVETVQAGGMGSALMTCLFRRTDIVHAHEARAAQVAMLRRLAGGPPYVVTRRVTHVPKANAFTRRVYRRADRLVAISQAVVEVMQRYEPSLTPVLIPDAIAHLPSDPFKIERLRRRYHGKFLVGHVGALDDSHKGQLVLIELARRLQRSHPRVHFLLVGDGRDRDRLHAAAAGLTNIEFAGWVDDVGNYLGAFDLFVFPSRHEAMGSVVLDAMDAGLPIVASRVGGLPEFVSGDIGVLVPPGDVDAFAAAVLGLADRPQRRAEMGEAARAQAARYTSTRMVQSYLRLYGALGLTEPGWSGVSS